MKNLFIAASILIVTGFAAACGGGSSSTTPATTSDTSSASNANTNASSGSSNAAASADPKGQGKFRNVELTHPLDQKMIADGQKVYDVKCSSCHKLTDEKLVGPGWKGVTSRRSPEWIMNFVTNTDEMLNKDPQAMSMLEVCLVRMPNQNLSDDEARAILEFQRNNDGAK